MKGLTVFGIFLWYMLVLVVCNIAIVELTDRPLSLVLSVIVGGILGYRMARKIQNV